MAHLSDEAWRAICAAAGPQHLPDDEAAALILIRDGEPASSVRAALSAILFEEYPKFVFDRESAAQTHKRAERALTALATLMMCHHAQFGTATEDDCAALDAILWRWEVVWCAADAIQRAHRGRRNVQREWLMHRLCSVWLDCFHGQLTFTVPALGGPPQGPTISFLCATMSQVTPAPSPATVRDAMLRERSARDRARQLSLDLRGRMPD